MTITTLHHVNGVDREVVSIDKSAGSGGLKAELLLQLVSKLTGPKQLQRLRVGKQLANRHSATTTAVDMSLKQLVLATVGRPTHISAGHSLLRSQFFLVALLPFLMAIVVVSTSASAASQQQQQSDNQPFIDPECKWTNANSSEAEKLLLIMKCDVQPLKRSFELLLPKFNGPQHLLSQTDVGELVRMNLFDLRDERAIKIWHEYLAFDGTIGQFYKDALAAIQRKEFCTYLTIERFKQLKTYVLNGSRLLADLYDLIAIEYHTYCLNEALKKLPKVPQSVKEIVDIYIDGKNSNLLPDLNRPPGFNDEKKDEFNFDLNKALASEGAVRDVIELTVNIWDTRSADEQVEVFKQDCKAFLHEIEERWQSMEMMSKMLSTEVNGIERYNNYLLRALIPTKYADVCSQLSSVS